MPIQRDDTVSDQTDSIHAQLAALRATVQRHRVVSVVLGCGVVAALTLGPVGAQDVPSTILDVTEVTEVNGQPTVVFSGVNVQIVNRSGTTGGAPNGTGNLIIGYDTPNIGGFNNKTGSHNLVVGEKNSYSSFGGVVFGFKNRSVAPYATVTGGALNGAKFLASVSGGFGNTASASFSSVSGGESNLASGTRASVSAGRNNTAQGAWSSVSGGGFALAEDGNVANGSYASISGGDENIASGIASSVCGGAGNTASGEEATVCGGDLNTASGEFATASGGLGNTASGQRSTVAGGQNSNATGVSGFLGGRNFIVASGCSVCGSDGPGP